MNETIDKTEEIETVLEVSEELFKKSTIFDQDCDILEKIKIRRDKLHVASNNLKDYFVGLDDIIDRVISSIEAWYVLPEIVTHPTIICLWGLTGTGKTDLVRRLIAELDFNDKFIEIQFAQSKGSSSEYDDFTNTIQGKLDRSTIGDQPGICLFDEIQRFRTIDEQGQELHSSKYNDLWELLSDGRFGNETSSKVNLIEYFLKDLYQMDQSDTNEVDEDTDTFEHMPKSAETEPPKVSRKKRYTYSYYSAQSLKSSLRLSESILDIMKWTVDKRRSVLQEKLNDKNFTVGTVYNKLLIILSGNLDEAYSMAKETSNADVDADTLHEFSKTIDIVTIKNALKRRFKPEQIARFGNNHVIYPSLSKDTYEKIIYRKISKIVDNVKDKSNVIVKFDKSVYQAVYDNGVYPAQGTRPVFSTISNMIESSVPLFVLEAIENKKDVVDISFESSHLISTFETKTIRRKVDCPLDIIKDNISQDTIALTSVHESGHGLAYTLLIGIAPSELKSKLSSHSCEGYLMGHQTEGSRVSIINDMVITLAGGVAEEIVFGYEKKTTGWSSDLSQATSLASCFVRRYGLGTEQVKIVSESSDEADAFVIRAEQTNDEITALVRKAYDDARVLINKNINLLKELSKELYKKGSLDDIEVVEICKNHGHTITIHPKGEKIITDYKKIFDDFIADCK